MSAAQIFAYTPPNPDTGLVGYVALHASEPGSGLLTVRGHGSAEGDTAACPIPAPDLLRLGDAATGAALSDRNRDEPMLQFFAFSHLPEQLQAVSRPFGLLALRLVDQLPRNPERTAMLRKLVEAKDCAVRALIYRA